MRALFLASLRFCVHYCIDRDTVQKKRFFCCDVHSKLENDLETSHTQINVLDLSMRTLVMHTNTHTHTHTHVVRVCLFVCVYMCVCVRAWAGVRGQVCLCAGGWVYVV